MLGVRGEGVGVSKSMTDCRGEPLRSWKFARSPEGVSATDNLDRDEDGGLGSEACDWDCGCGSACECDCNRERLCALLRTGVAGPAGGGWTGRGGDGDNEYDEVGTVGGGCAATEGRPTAPNA